MDWREYIEADPTVMVDKPVIKGTRIPVDLILEKLAFQSFEETLLDYPQLSSAQLQAAVLYVLDVHRTDDVVRVGV